MMNNFGKKNSFPIKRKSIIFSRRNIFEENVQMIQQHNLEADLGLHTFTMKVNHFADLVRLFSLMSI